MSEMSTDEDRAGQSFAGQKREAITQLAAIVFSDQSIEVRERAFATLMGAAPDIAGAVATLASLISPNTAPLWQAIMSGPVTECQSRACLCRRVGGRPHTTPTPAPSWGAEDAKDTADGIAALMGWYDVEAETEGN